MKANGARIRQLCEERRMTQKELARKAGIPASSLNKMINDEKYSGKISRLKWVADVLGVEVSSIYAIGTMEAISCDSISGIIKKLRLERGLEPEELATLSGVSASTLRDIERNNRKPHHKILEAIAKALGVEADELSP